MEGDKRDDVGSAVSPCGSQRKTARSTIASNAAEAVRTRRTTWNCYTPTVIGKSTCKKGRQSGAASREGRL